jgi:plastocyanin
MIYVGMYGAGAGGNYMPANITVVIGVNNTVEWINNDTDTPHTVTSNSGDPASFNSGNLNPGQTYTFTFTVAGTYEYYCEYHSWMTGEVVVES